VAQGTKPTPGCWKNAIFHLHERLLALIDGCDAAIALPGGVGTLLEIAMMWNRMIVDAIPQSR
jgi:predicted Rossmann-fold nucleotide-binding protein